MGKENHNPTKKVKILNLTKTKHTKRSRIKDQKPIKKGDKEAHTRLHEFHPLDVSKRS